MSKRILIIIIAALAFGLFQISTKFTQMNNGSNKDFVPIPTVGSSTPTSVPSPSTQTSVFYVYFGQTKSGENQLDCTQVFPLQRNVAQTSQIASAAMESLLTGPTATEKEQGYFTSINPGVKINKLEIVNNTAYIDFDSTIEYQVGGSCRVINIFSQIDKTLLQFSTIKKTQISVDGRTDLILQP